MDTHEHRLETKGNGVGIEFRMDGSKPPGGTTFLSENEFLVLSVFTSIHPWLKSKDSVFDDIVDVGVHRTGLGVSSRSN